MNDRTYFDERRGVDRPERRERDRGPRNARVEEMFNGFHNVLENSSGYTQGYLRAMMLEFAALMNKDARPLAPVAAAWVLADHVLHLNMVTPAGLRARELARQVLASDDAPHEGECADVLRSLASFLGAGGYSAPAVDPKVFHEKILWGIEEVRKEAALFSKKPLSADDAKPHAVNVPGYGYVDVKAVRAIERALGVGRDEC